MRYAVRDTKPPFDVVGYVEAPVPAQLAEMKFAYAFPLSRHLNGHRLHHEEQTPARLTLQIGLYRRHGARCACGSCPPADACFMSMGHPPELLRHIVGYIPHTILRVAPAAAGLVPGE